MWREMLVKICKYNCVQIDVHTHVCDYIFCRLDQACTLHFRGFASQHLQRVGNNPLGQIIVMSCDTPKGSFFQPVKSPSFLSAWAYLMKYLQLCPVYCVVFLKSFVSYQSCCSTIDTSIYHPLLSAAPGEFSLWCCYGWGSTILGKGGRWMEMGFIFL